jgi:1-acyl-sn-glycerol-3-phosphate acyltransferase
MILLRSSIFMAALVLVTVPYAFIAMASAPFDIHFRQKVIHLWSRMAMWLVRHVLGIDHRVLGRENIPREPSVVLCKHQSAWETIALQFVFPPQAFVLKKELLRVPFFGWGLAQYPIISIDRRAGKDALAQVVEQGRELLRKGFWVVVFPEGTRVPPGRKRRFKSGGAHLAAETGVPVVPVAHNAGEFWRRKAFLKFPGIVTVSIGPPILTEGLSTIEINSRAQAWIESEMRRLFPHHYSATAEQPT